MITGLKTYQKEVIADLKNFIKGVWVFYIVEDMFQSIPIDAVHIVGNHPLEILDALTFVYRIVPITIGEEESCLGCQARYAEK